MTCKGGWSGCAVVAKSGIIRVHGRRRDRFLMAMLLVLPCLMRRGRLRRGRDLAIAYRIVYHGRGGGGVRAWPGVG
jgi:hypothetical protein